MAENLAKLQASWAGYQTHLMQTCKKSPQIMARETPIELDFLSEQHTGATGQKEVNSQGVRPKKSVLYLTIRLNLRRRSSTQKLFKKALMRPLHR